MSTYHRPTNLTKHQDAAAEARAPGRFLPSGFDGRDFQRRYQREFGHEKHIGRFTRVAEIKEADPAYAIWLADHHAGKVRASVLRELVNSFGFGTRPASPGITLAIQCRFARELPDMFRDRLEAVFAGLEHHGFDQESTARAAFNHITRQFVEALEDADQRTNGMGKGRMKAQAAAYRPAVSHYINALDDWLGELRADFFGGGISAYWNVANTVSGISGVHVACARWAPLPICAGSGPDNG